MSIVEVSTGYTPRPLQALLHKSLKRFNVLSLHRRAGKTVFSINEMLDQGLRNTKKNPRYAYIAPTFGAAKRIAWDYLKDAVKSIPNIIEVNEAELRVDIARPATGDKVRFQLLGAENPNAIRGIYLDGAILDEYSMMSPEIWTHVIRPALSDRLGWAIFISTPNGMNHFFELFQYAKEHPEDWFCAIYKASETGIVPKAELEAALHLMGESVYNQEFECSFSAALVGAYYGKELEKMDAENRITRVPYDPAVGVYTGWDLGISDTTAIWFVQLVGKAIHVIDYIESSGAGLDYYVKEIKERNYNYEEHLLPHDAAARDLSTGKTRVQTLQSLGLQRVRVVPKLSVEDGINAVRLLLGKMWADRDKVKRGLDCLRNYERKWDEKNKVFQSRPLHNWASHGADAMRTLAVGINEDRPTRTELSRMPRMADMNYNVFGGKNG